MVRGNFRCVPEEMRMSTFQVILSGMRVQALKVNHMSFIASYFGQLMCFVPRSEGKSTNSSPADTLSNEDVTRETRP